MSYAPLQLTIETGIPLGTYNRPGIIRNVIAETFQMMRGMESFTISENRRGIVYSTAKELGLEITSKKIEKDLVRVWLLETGSKKLQPVKTPARPKSVNDDAEIEKLRDELEQLHRQSAEAPVIAQIRPKSDVELVQVSALQKRLQTL
jgi:hypothetical protein